MSAPGGIRFSIATGGLKAQRLLIPPNYTKVESMEFLRNPFFSEKRGSSMDLANVLEAPFHQSGNPPWLCSCPSSDFRKRILEAASSAASMAVFDWDLGAFRFNCPESFRERLALQEGETIAQNLGSGDRDVFWECIRKALKGEPNEIRRVRWTKDGENSRVLTVADAELERDAAGKPKHLLVLVRDLTVAEEAIEVVKNIHNSAKVRVTESQTLVREMNHRVKNNLQIVCSLIHSHSDGLNDHAARSSFRDIESRVRTIAHLHDRLSTGFGTLETTAILRDLAALVAQSSALPADRIVLDLENVTRPLEVSQAMPFAMAANELLMNSLQHGTTGSPVTVQLRTLQDGALRLTIRNASRSSPSVSNSGLGLEIVRALCRQLGATFHSEFAWNEAASHLVLAPQKEAPRA